MSPPGTPRDGERVALDAFVKAAAGDTELVFRVRDLSRSGLFLYTRVARTYPFRPGTTLSIELFDFDQTLTLKVVVARVVEPGSPESETSPTGFGVRIVDADPATRTRLEALIDRIKAGDTIY
ncbi:MAG: PilZ domain-containing protein [Myxococcales bacterium]|nr:PilZ domain-containing protein [Myxococcales bacterium]